MWVLNQDGLCCVKTDALALDPSEIMSEEKRKNGVRVWGSTADHDYVLGVYHDLDEAKTVIKEFFDLPDGTTKYAMPPAKSSKEVQ